MNKKLLYFITLSFFLLFNNISIKAQSNWELGLRAGDLSGIDATIPLAMAPRLHPTVYLFEKHISAGVYFDWLFSLQDGPAGLKFYPGLGPEIYFGPEVEVGAAGNFGAEYSFDFPLTVAIDWRPGFIVTEGLHWHSDNIGIIARFRFGEGVKFKRAN